MHTLKLFDIVALLDDVPNDNVYHGQVGTIVEKLADDVFEVEFNDDNGVVYVQATLRAD
ncbi:MAG: DUF4926 domain-containing protein [Anaerolineae bacterium]|jgi:hypothetical protein|nr:DUF4926 domain-containing protein [Anaerolineae bacterium]